MLRKEDLYSFLRLHVSPNAAQELKAVQKAMDTPVSEGLPFGWITRAIPCSGNQLARERAAAFDKLCRRHDVCTDSPMDDQAYRTALSGNLLNLKKYAVMPHGVKTSSSTGSMLRTTSLYQPEWREGCCCSHHLQEGSMTLSPVCHSQIVR
jgi:hypothetical protein